MKQITLNDQEEKALLFLIDAAVKQIGLQSVAAANVFQTKIENASAVAPRRPRKRKSDKVVNLKDN